MQTRRVRKSAEQWSELVDQFDSSEDSMESFCQRQNVAMSTFQRWRSMIRRSKNLDTHDPDPAFTRVTGAAAPRATIPTVVTLQIGGLITVTIQTEEST